MPEVYASVFQDKEPLRSIPLRDIQKVHECLVKSGWVKNKSLTQSLFLLHCFSESLWAAHWSDFIRRLILVWPALFVYTVVKKTRCVSTFISHEPILFDFKTRHLDLVTLNFRLIGASKIVFLQTAVCFNCVVNLPDNHNFLWENNSCLSEPAVWNGNLNLLECPAFVSDDVRSATHSWRLSSLDLINKLNTV